MVNEINLPEVYLTPIKAWLAEGRGVEYIVAQLSQNGFKIHRQTLAQRLCDLGLRDPSHSREAIIWDEGLLDFVERRFWETWRTDAQLVADCKKEGYSVSVRQIRTIRNRLGLKKQVVTKQESQALWSAVLKAVRLGIEDGIARNYGRGLMRTYLRVECGIIATKHYVEHALRLVDREATVSRKPGMRRTRR